MKTLQLLCMEESRLVPLLKTMKTKERKRHAQNIIKKFGGTGYDELMLNVIRQVKSSGAAPSDCFAMVQTEVGKAVSGEGVGEAGEEVRRLSLLMTLIMVDEYQAIKKRL